MKTGKSLNELVAEIVRQNETKQDYVVRSNALTLRSNGVSNLALPGVGEYEMNDIAHGQVREHLDIPAAYYKKLQMEVPALLDANVNTLLARKSAGERRMVRTLDGRARAFLSDRYRRLDNHDLAEVILPELLSQCELEFASCEITEQRLYIKVTTPRIQAEVTPGDVVQAGLMVTNSEVGLGALAVVPYTVRLVCVNGAVHNDYGTRKSHVGRYITDVTGQDAYLLFADETLQADDRAFYLMVRDVVRGALSDGTLERLVGPMREAAGAKLEGDPVKAVEVLAKKQGLNNDERGSVLRHLIEGGDLSLWGLSNAITRTATDAESYDRATELEQLGGNIINLPRTEWRALAVAA